MAYPRCSLLNSFNFTVLIVGGEESNPEIFSTTEEGDIENLNSGELIRHSEEKYFNSKLS